MVNMAFSAEAEQGRSVDAAAVEALSRCAEFKLEATVALHNNVLATLAKRSPPEATLSWLARMRASKIPLDVVACNIQLDAALKAPTGWWHSSLPRPPRPPGFGPGLLHALWRSTSAAQTPRGSEWRCRQPVPRPLSHSAPARSQAEGA